jgi:predicted ATPase
MNNGKIAMDPVLLVDQFRHGLSLVDVEEERVALAQLCMQAARISAKTLSISSSTIYIDLARSLLLRRHWRDFYDLSLDVFGASVELSYATGQHDKIAATVSEVEENARNIEDTARARTGLVFSLGSQHRICEAIDTSLGLLKDLQEPLPSKVGILAVLLEARKTSKMLRKFSDKDLLLLPRLTDRKKLAAMHIFNIVFMYNLVSRPLSAALISMRIVQVSIRHGLSEVSSIGFSSYGMFVLNNFDDMDIGLACPANVRRLQNAGVVFPCECSCVLWHIGKLRSDAPIRSKDEEGWI